VRLPLRAASSALATEPPPPAAGAARRILLVEDNEDLSEMTRELLQALGHQVSTAATGTEGVESAQALRPDLVLIDLGLPGIDGYEVARRIRGALGSATPRLVALTGYGDKEARVQSEAAGFDVHVVKPFSDEDLTRILDGI
jgi:CheY-like chemotaxis protein